MNKIPNMNEARLGITIVEEIIVSFTKDEILTLSNDEMIDMIDAQNGYEEDWQSWKDSGIYTLYVEAIKLLKTHLGDIYN